MAQDWHALTDLLGDKEFAVTEIRIKGSDITVRGEFDMSPLAGLRYEDQVFVGEFVRAHGSIKHMEKAFGISYPTVKNRLNRIAAQLKLVEIDIEPAGAAAEDVLGLLERGEISAAEAADRLRR